MEQDLKVYEYRLNASTTSAAPSVESYSFEAPNHTVAETYREYALMHFREATGNSLKENAISGPFLVVPKSVPVTGNA